MATPKDITRYDGIEDKLDNPPKPVMVYDKLPGDVPHGWKFIKIGPDGKLYVPVGAPCNICEPDREEVHADPPHEPRRQRHRDRWRTACATRWASTGIRRPGELWFGDNQRDWLAEDMPNDELNRVTKAGQHFGYPYCHSG